MADNHKSPLRPEGEDLLQVSDLTLPYTLFLTFSFVPRRPSPTHSPSPTFPAFLPSSLQIPQHHSYPQTAHPQSHQIRRSLPQQQQPRRQSPPSRPRSSAPGKRSTTRRSPSGADRARPCVRVQKRNVRGGRSAGHTNSSSSIRRMRVTKGYSGEIRMPQRQALARAIGRPSRTGAVRTRTRRPSLQQHHRPWQHRLLRARRPRR